MAVTETRSVTDMGLLQSPSTPACPCGAAPVGTTAHLAGVPVPSVSVSVTEEPRTGLWLGWMNRDRHFTAQPRVHTPALLLPLVMEGKVLRRFFLG